MKVYKDGVKVNADKDQWPALEKAGWTRTPEEAEKSEDVTEAEETPEEEKAEETPKKTPAKKPAPKRRKPIAKKSDSEE